MIKDELIQRSAVKTLEKTTGALEAGEIGVIASPFGIGKTSVLVQIALYKLLQGKKVVHVSFTQPTSYVLSWYEDIFAEVVKNKSVANEKELTEELTQNRVLLNFNQNGVTSDTIRASLYALIKEGGFNADSIIIDGFDFSKATAERVEKLKSFAKENGISLWYSCAVTDFDGKGCPKVLAPIAADIDIVLVMEEKGDHIALRLVKNRAAGVGKNETLKLDPKTLLLAE